jgi:hypothetical protein
MAVVHQSVKVVHRVKMLTAMMKQDKDEGDDGAPHQKNHEQRPGKGPVTDPGVPVSVAPHVENPMFVALLGSATFSGTTAHKLHSDIANKPSQAHPSTECTTEFLLAFTVVYH